MQIKIHCRNLSAQHEEAASVFEILFCLTLISTVFLMLLKRKDAIPVVAEVVSDILTQLV